MFLTDISKTRLDGLCATLLNFQKELETSKIDYNILNTKGVQDRDETRLAFAYMNLKKLTQILAKISTPHDIGQRLKYILFLVKKRC